MNFQDIISIIGIFGLGSVTATLVGSWSKRKERKSETNHSFKELRYKAIILLMYCLVEWDRDTKQIVKRPDISSEDDLLNELKAESINMSLYASDKVILAMKVFIYKPNYETLAKCAFAMRYDLYGLKSSLKPENFVLNNIYGPDSVYS